MEMLSGHAKDTRRKKKAKLALAMIHSCMHMRHAKPERKDAPDLYGESDATKKLRGHVAKDALLSH